MSLSHNHTQQLFERGYTVVPGVIPSLVLRDVLRRINHSLGSKGMNEEDLPYLRARSYCRELQETPEITDLFNHSPLYGLLESAIGAGCVQHNGSGQIALRFPGMKDPPAPPKPHIDGVPTEHNGGTPGQLGSFTALAVILLSDLPEPFMGNFTVWSGTHRSGEAWFREHGPEKLFEVGIPGGDLPEPVQITGKAGDVCISHFQLLHSAAPNASPHVRYAAIFRVKRVNHDTDFHPACYTDIWREWDGMRAFTGEAEPAYSQA